MDIKLFKQKKNKNWFPPHFRERRSCPFEPTQSLPANCDLLQVRGQSLGYLKAAHTDSHHTDAPDSVTGLTISPDY